MNDENEPHADTEKSDLSSGSDSLTQQYTPEQSSLVANWLCADFICTLDACREPGIFAFACYSCRRHALVCFEHKNESGNYCPICQYPLQAMRYHRIVSRH